MVKLAKIVTNCNYKPNTINSDSRKKHEGAPIGMKPQVQSRGDD